MNETELMTIITQKGFDRDKIAEQVILNPHLILALLVGMNAEKANIKYSSEKVLRIISEQRPELLYRHFDFFVSLLDHENSFLKWGAIAIVANLTTVDSEQKFEKIFKKYFAPIPGPVLVTAANVIGGAAKVAQAKPELIEKVTKEILKVQKAKYKTPECRNVAIGQAITSLDQFFEQIPNKKKVLTFVQKQLKNTRNSVRKSAEKFMNNHVS